MTTEKKKLTDPRTVCVYVIPHDDDGGHGLVGIPLIEVSMKPYEIAALRHQISKYCAAVRKRRKDEVTALNARVEAMREDVRERARELGVELAEDAPEVGGISSTVGKG